MIRPNNFEDLIKWFSSKNHFKLYLNKKEGNKDNKTYLVEIYQSEYKQSNYIKIGFNLSHKWLYVAIHFTDKKFICLDYLTKHCDSIDEMFNGLKKLLTSYTWTIQSEITDNQEQFNYIWDNIPLESFEKYID